MIVLGKLNKLKVDSNLEVIMKVLVCGGRNLADYELVKKSLSLHTTSSCQFILGGARGADSLAELYAKENGRTFRVFPADWEKHGRAAGFIRNKEMIDQGPNLVIAFWDGFSRGTKNTIDLAKKQDIKVIIIKFK